MRVLALTHAQLNPDGLSPVSCERVDSIAGTWAENPDWTVDVIHTTGTKWRGIWPGGQGLKINIISAEAPAELLMTGQPSFGAELRMLVAAKRVVAVGSLAGGRIAYRVRAALAGRGIMMPYDMAVADKWGKHLSTHKSIRSNQYDFLFVCVGYGDEYLLQTAFTLAKRLHVPIVADLRDLWSEHHDPGRFTEQQKQRIRRYELRLLSGTVMISVPQKHMKTLLDRWVNKPVYLLSHSAYMDKSWQEGSVTSNEFVMLYAGKLYAAGPGIKMLLQLLQQLAQLPTAPKPFRCRFFVDETATLERLAAEYGVTEYVEINGWVAPSELWKQMRSAHLLLVPDPGVAENYPLLPTKTLQYAYTGRQLLALLLHPNTEMEEFLNEHNAGMATTSVQEAAAWTKQLISDHSLYETLPPLRKIPLREELAAAYGSEIEKIIAGK